MARIYRMRTSLEQRFWRQVDCRGPDECWEWQSSRTAFGYGQFMVNYKNHRTHRFAWELRNGAVPDGLHVLHRCDNPPCVNPAHLFLGTDADNNTDKARKLRSGRAKLCPCSVRAIRVLAAEGASLGDLGRRFGVSKCPIALVIAGKTWKHVA